MGTGCSTAAANGVVGTEAAVVAIGAEAEGEAIFLQKDSTGAPLLQEDPLPRKQTNLEVSKMNRRTTRNETTTSK